LLAIVLILVEKGGMKNKELASFEPDLTSTEKIT
jgi:hypothetical protein